MEVKKYSLIVTNALQCMATKRLINTALSEKLNQKPQVFLQNRTETDRSRPVWNCNNTTVAGL